MPRDLKSLTIFDLTDDHQLITDVLEYETSKEQYLAGVAPESIPLDMLRLAEHTGDEELVADLNKTFAEALSLLFNE
jgi:hypothetical protein